jgi:nucleotide-binding universal stress UspA family protein
MNDSSRGPVIVGIDGTIRSIEATRWAAHEAARKAVGLEIVHAGFLTHLKPLPDDRTVTDGSLADAYITATDAEPSLHVKTITPAEQPAHYLIAQSAEATMVVLGTHPGNSLAGVLLGSIAQAVAAHAMCPVAVIGKSKPESASKLPVVVGVSPHPGGKEALRLASDEARLRGVELVAVRSWGDVDWGVGRLGYNTELFTEWRRMERDLLRTCLAEVEVDFPEVIVRPELKGKRAQLALQQAAAEAQLLVVGAHRRDDHWFSRLGPVPSWLLHRSPCPLVIVGQPHVLPTGLAQDDDASAIRAEVSA